MCIPISFCNCWQSPSYINLLYTHHESYVINSDYVTVASNKSLNTPNLISRHICIHFLNTATHKCTYVSVHADNYLHWL